MSSAMTMVDRVIFNRSRYGRTRCFTVFAFRISRARRLARRVWLTKPVAAAARPITRANTRTLSYNRELTHPICLTLV